MDSRHLLGDSLRSGSAGGLYAAAFSNGGITWGKNGLKSEPRVRLKQVQAWNKHNASTPRTTMLTFDEVWGPWVFSSGDVVLYIDHNLCQSDGIAGECLCGQQA